MRYIRYLFLAVVGLSLILLALANRDFVTLKLLPDELSSVLGLAETLSLPLFAVILFSVFVGLAIGFIWEYLREYKHRRNLTQSRKEVRGLEREVRKLKGKTRDEKDDILALIE